MTFLPTKLLTYARLASFRRNISVFRASFSKVEVPSNRITSVNLETVELSRIRNFSIVAHIDHGKSTLADRILEHVGAIPKSKENKQVLDKLPVERERGITVKAQTAAIIFEHKGQDYLLNLIDTPGHVDFSSEVSKSLASCQGVILLVDANQGVQAQTVSNFYLAFGNDLAIIPVINKIDLPNADVEGVKSQLNNLFDIDPDSVLLSSAKKGIGVQEILEAVIERIPSPEKTHGKLDNLRLLIQDSWYDKYKGAVNLVQIFDGVLRLNTQVTSFATKKSYTVKTLELLTPNEVSIPALYPGQVGIFTCNLRSTSDVIIGDTYFEKDKQVPAIMEVKTPTPMVFAGIYPYSSKEHPKLKSAIEKVLLNDSSVTCSLDTSLVFGSGWRIGFLGLLHMEVFVQRLEQEFDAKVMTTSPSVPYKVILKDSALKKLGGHDMKKELLITKPNEWIDKIYADHYLEPWVTGTIIIPNEYFQRVTSLCKTCRGEETVTKPIDDKRLRMEWKLPLSEILVDFFDKLKQLTSGYGSFDYEDAGFREALVVKIDLHLNSDPVPELSFIAHASRARDAAKDVLRKLKEHLPRQQIKIVLQAVANNKIIAREDLAALRKDVTAKCYGGDLTRKRKLLERQAEGKKKMLEKSIGNIKVPKETFIKVFKK